MDICKRFHKKNVFYSNGEVFFNNSGQFNRQCEVSLNNCTFPLIKQFIKSNLWSIQESRLLTTITICKVLR